MTELVIERRKNRALQVRPMVRKGWTKADRKRFLDVLASTCNVRAATRAIGRGRTAPYHLRARDAAFAALWDEALAIGYERLETAVLERALIGVNAIEIEGDELEETLRSPEIAEPSDERSDEEAARRPVPGSGVRPLAALGEVQLALAVLNRARAAAEGRRLPGRNRRRPTDEEALASLEKQLDALARRSRTKAE